MEPLGGQHALSMIIIRYISFIQSLKKSPKLAVQFLVEKVLNNCNTLTGKNVRLIMEKTKEKDILNININKVKREFKFCEIDEENEWRVNFAKELVNIKKNILQLDEDVNSLTEEDLEEILLHICTN